MIWTGPHGAQAQERRYILATATTGGTFYPVGVAIATMTKVRLQPQYGISLSAVSSAGSAENVKLLREDQAQFAIIQGLYGAWAAKGEGPLSDEGPQTHLRAVTRLWDNVDHFIVSSRYAQSGTVADLTRMQGRKFSIGRRNSGAEGSGRYILEAIGLDPDTAFNLVYLGYGPSANALQNNTIDGANIPAGIPVSAVTQAFAAKGNELTLLGFTNDHLEQINQKYPLWKRAVIPAETYPGQTSDVASISHANVLVVRENVDEEAVYLITKTIYENLAYLGSRHPATKVMSLDLALSGLPMGLHPGAARYYREAGLEIPADLASQ